MNDVHSYNIIGHVILYHVVIRTENMGNGPGMGWGGMRMCGGDGVVTIRHGHLGRSHPGWGLGVKWIVGGQPAGLRLGGVMGAGIVGAAVGAGMCIAE